MIRYIFQRHLLSDMLIQKCNAVHCLTQGIKKNRVVMKDINDFEIAALYPMNEATQSEKIQNCMPIILKEFFILFLWIPYQH